MKKFLISLLVAASTSLAAYAEFENWKTKEGGELRLKLIDVVREGDVLKGRFETEDGQTVIHAADAFAPEEATRLDSWKRLPGVAPAGPTPRSW